jgi:uncharacterized phage protein (TIGR01671 family)
MYRVYDNYEKIWLKEDVYLSPNNDLYISKKTLFSAEKLFLVSDNKYIWHKDIGLYDKNKKLIFEGDICRIEYLDVIGIIAYVPEHASYYILDDKNLNYYTLGEDRCEQIEVIGNVCENQDLLQNDNSEEGE